MLSLKELEKEPKAIKRKDIIKISIQISEIKSRKIIKKIKKNTSWLSKSSTKSTNLRKKERRIKLIKPEIEVVILLPIL